MPLDQSKIVAHFTQSANRYALKRPIPSRDDFVITAWESFAGNSIKILDVGCGTGHRLEGVRRYFPEFKLQGMDITPAMTQLAHQNYSPKIRFMVGDTLHLPYQDKSFQGVILSEVLHHLITNDRRLSNEFRENGFREVVRLLDDDGLIFLLEVCVNTKWRAATLFYLSQTFARLNLSLPQLNVHSNVVVNFYTESELEETIEQLGLKIEEKRIAQPKKISNWVIYLFSQANWTTYVLRK